MLQGAHAELHESWIVCWNALDGDFFGLPSGEDHLKARAHAGANGAIFCIDAFLPETCQFGVVL